MYQLPFAEQIRAEVGIPVMAVGGIQGADHVNTQFRSGNYKRGELGREVDALHDRLHAVEVSLHVRSYDYYKWK